MKTFRIERVDGEFEVCLYERAWFREKRSMLGRHERLQSAEEHMVHAVVENYSRELDRRRFAPLEASIADCEPRAAEEHIYTSLVLQGIKPPESFEVIPMIIYDKFEEAIGRPTTRVEQRLFLHRFMSWYALNTPDYNDPRLQPVDEFARGFAAPAPPVNMANHTALMSAARAWRNLRRLATGKWR